MDLDTSRYDINVFERRPTHQTYTNTGWLRPNDLGHNRNSSKEVGGQRTRANRQAKYPAEGVGWVCPLYTDSVSEDPALNCCPL